MSNTISTLLNLRALRAQARELSLEQLQDALDKLALVVNERAQYEEQEFEKQKEKLEKIETYRQLLLDEGITAEELVAHIATPSTKKTTRKPRPPKYRYVDDKGVEKTWTGQGRTPLFLVNKNLDDFLIKS